MIVERISSGALKVVAPRKLKGDDFLELAPQVDAIIREHGQLRLLIDASNFDGWANLDAFEKHANFIKEHQQKVGRIAVIAGHDWQYWVVGALKVLLHPEVRAYDTAHEADALKWIEG